MAANRYLNRFSGLLLGVLCLILSFPLQAGEGSATGVAASAGQVLPDEMTVNIGDVPGVARNVTLVLTKRSIRSDRYQIATWSKDGFKKIDPLPVSTYRGYVKDESAIRVDANVEPGGLLTAVYSDGIMMWEGISIEPRKIEIPAGKSTPCMPTGNRVIPFKPTRQSPTPGGYLVPPCPMRRYEAVVLISNALVDDLDGNIETAVSQVEQRLNDVDLAFARDIGAALEVVAIVVFLDDSRGFSPKMIEELTGGKKPNISMHFGGSKGHPSGGGASTRIFTHEGASLSCARANIRNASGVAHELGHNFGGHHQVDKVDCENGALSFIGPNNIQLMLQHCTKAKEEQFPAVIYNGVLQPLAMPDFGNTTKDKPVAIDVLDNDYDGNGDTLLLQSVSEQSWRGGKVIMSDDRKKAIYTPPQGFVGVDRFTYVVVDSTGIPNRMGKVKVRVDGDGLASYFPLDGIGPGTVMVGPNKVMTYADQGPFGTQGVPFFVDDDFNPLARGEAPAIPDEFCGGVRGKALFNSIAGPKGVAASFPNTGDPGRGSLSVSLWVLFPGKSSGTILCKGGPTAYGCVSGWAISRVGEKGFSFSGCMAANGEEDRFGLQWSKGVQANTWYHLTMVLDRDAKKLRAWVNGDEATEAAGKAEVPDGVIAGYAPMLLFNSFVWKRQSALSVVADELRVYTSALTPKQVAQLYAEGKDAPVPDLTGLARKPAPPEKQSEDEKDK